MMDKNVLLAQFWANANQLVTPDGLEIDLHNDDLVVLSITLRNVEDYPYTLQLKAEFGLDAFAKEMETQLVDDLTEINLDLLFALLIAGKAAYSIFKQ
ncbi:hypothetical protein [Pedobacter africanus]|uniref:Uncharacterized protein n=1 Tax=Pedobacter africanus TaxID=151894 RepID=A0A1W2A0G7_9SPHI|nr:hypothetical protein [Pedobacter africanus]SMC54195.1 hypothetical protein SAMN04488524_1139 [Pedobacter africanus]